jgi:exoribonuclease R
MYPLLISFYEKWKRDTLDIPHLMMKINDMGELYDYYCEHNTDINHKIIESLMILTNITISTYITIPQRYHMKLKNELKCENITGNNIIDNILTIKKYKNATYENNNSGHFGLKLDSYTHFTSPIRRYFDVIVHRMLAGINYNNLDIILEYINKRERYIDNIIKLYNNLKLYSYMEKNINKIYEAYVINTTDNGVVCIIKDFLYEVFIFTKNKYKIGNIVNVKVKSIVWTTMEIKAIIN